LVNGGKREGGRRGVVATKGVGVVKAGVCPILIIGI